jgi:hypothetical protein
MRISTESVNITPILITRFVQLITFYFSLYLCSSLQFPEGKPYLRSCYLTETNMADNVLPSFANRAL